MTTFKIPTFLPFSKLSVHNNPNPERRRIFYLCLSLNHTINSLTLNFNCKRYSASVSCSAAIHAPVATTARAEITDDRIQRLVSEFESLKEPIDRVKRLLDYAARLPPFDESARLPGNRVMGCTTQVWLEARMDEHGRMRFRADSDSEITKGFISCLIWLLDGAEPGEVVAVKSENLGALNVGLHGKAQSRVNTWHNVLISMQNRTKALDAKRKELHLEQSLVVESFAQAQVGRNLFSLFEFCLLFI